MDHRISKDMISNGMTPSGQKSQQDLSRSQYGSAATPSSLAEAYRKIHEMDERSPEANAAKQEAAKLKAQKARQAASEIKRVDTPSDSSNTQNTPSDSSKNSGSTNRTPITAGGGVPSQSGQVDRYRQMARERARKSGSLGMGESADLFDIVKDHLMSEGLSEEDALKKMLKMTEEEKAEIVEMNAGPSTPVKEYDGKIMPNYGGGRIGKVRPKKGQV
jgi:hypothetical protein